VQTSRFTEPITPLVFFRTVTSNLVCSDLVVLHRHHRFPAKPGWILNGVELRSSGTVERDVKPIVAFEPNGGLVLIGQRQVCLR